MRRRIILVSMLALSLGGLAALPLLNQGGQVRAQQTLVPLSRCIDADLIRVGISDDSMMNYEYPVTEISATGPFTVQDQATGTILMNGQSGDRLTITVNANGFVLKPIPTPTNLEVKQLRGPISIQPAAPHTRLKILNITRRKEIPEYRGSLEIVRGSSSPNKLTVINILELEDYLKAVVPNELPMRYGLEAVKAQAIAARNYAIRPREKFWKTFDICDSQLCQVYFGAQSETPGSNQAIADTEGLIALYDGEPVLALFSSAHGGYSEAYSNAFSDPKTKQYPAPPIPYLSGGPDIPTLASLDLTKEEEARKFWTNPSIPSYDVESPYYRWEKRWSGAELQHTLEQGLLAVSTDGSTRDFVSPLFRSGQRLGPIKNIRVLTRGKSGKAMVVAIEAANGTWTLKKEFVIRKVFSSNGRMLPSGNVVFTPTRDAKGNITALLAQGGGFGHGVGMSQLGASWMSKHGKKFPEIIQHYYKGASLGSKPLTVGGDGKPAQAIYTRFGVHRPQGRLWIEDSTGASQEPVTVQLNDRLLSLTPTGPRTAADIHAFLKPGELNTLVLFPDLNNPTRRLKAWVELYPAQGPNTPRLSHR
jgi:stage II sporulation protein D